MVLLRGLLGAKASFVPTVLNIAQCLGWAVFELLVIAAGLEALTGGHLPRWVCVLARRRRHHRVDHLAAGLDPGAAQVRVGAGGHRPGGAGRRRAAQPDADHRGVVGRILVGGGRGGRADHLLGAAGRRLLAAFPDVAGGLRRWLLRLRGHPDRLPAARSRRTHPGAAGSGPGVRPVPGGAAGHGRVRGAGAAGDRPELRQRLLHRRLDPEHGAAVGPADPDRRDRRRSPSRPP